MLWNLWTKMAVPNLPNEWKSLYEVGRELEKKQHKSCQNIHGTCWNRSEFLRFFVGKMRTSGFCKKMLTIFEDLGDK